MEVHQHDSNIKDVQVCILYLCRWWTEIEVNGTVTAPFEHCTVVFEAAQQSQLLQMRITAFRAMELMTHKRRPACAPY